MNFLLITTSYFDEDGRNKSAKEIFQERISKNRWAIYSNTRNKKRLKVNDNIIFYVSDRKTGGEIVASAQASEIIRPLRNERFDTEQDTVEVFLSFKAINFFETRIFFKDLLPKMSFCPTNKSKWGVVLMGGVRQLNDRDYAILKDA